MEPRASTALTTAGMAALRRAAVMAHTVGTISLRLSSNGERIVDVRPDAMDVAVRPCRGRVIDPCGFRMAVARAWADHEAGREIGLIGVGPQDELSMESAPPSAWACISRAVALGWPRMGSRVRRAVGHVEVEHQLVVRSTRTTPRRARSCG